MATASIDRLRLRHLRLLEGIKELGSLRAVAEEMNLSQPAVSQMLKDLETAFSSELVLRSARGVELSSVGHLALTRLRPCLSLIDRLIEEMRQETLPMLRCGANPTVMMHRMPEALRWMESQGRPLRFDFRTGIVGDMVSALCDGDLDCYVGHVDWRQIPVHQADLLRVRALENVPMSIVAAKDHPLAEMSEVAPEDLLGWDWALPAESSANRSELVAQFRNVGLSAPVASVEAKSDLPGLLRLVSTTRLLTCVPESALGDPLLFQTLTRLNVQGFALRPARIAFVSLVDPGASPMMKDLLTALLQSGGQ